MILGTRGCYGPKQILSVRRALKLGSSLMPAPLLPIQQWLRPSLPTIEGNIDYERLRQQLLRIDQLLLLLLQGGIQAQFIAVKLN